MNSILLFFFTAIIYSDSLFQNIDLKKLNFDYQSNAENLNGSYNENEGLVMTFDLYNKDGKIGNGGGWIIYSEGTKRAEILARELYPKNNLRGITFIKDLFQVKQRNPKVDSTMLKNFDIYLYIIGNQFLEKRLNTDGEGAGKTYSYYEKYPLDIVVYKREAGKDYFSKINTYHVVNEDEYFKSIKMISDYRKKTAVESNL
jgi:hypothetical protein